MSEWLVLSQTVTSRGEAREFGMATDGGELDRLFAIAAERVGSGGSDSLVPRRALGIGADRASARADLDDVISRYDPSYRVVFAR